MKSRGISLLETVLACSIFSLAIMALFSMLSFGFQAFALGTQRAGMQGEMEAVMTRIRTDIEASTLNSVQITNGAGRTCNVPLSSGLTSQPRHILGVCALSNWSAPASFSVDSGLPYWDRHILYQSTLDPTGSLFRVEINPGATGDGGGWADFSAYCTSYPSIPPARNTAVGAGRVLSKRRLAQNVLGFSATKTVNSVVLSLLLSGQGQKGINGARRSEVFEVKARISPRNRLQ
jgi:hypothetical protein